MPEQMSQYKAGEQAQADYARYREKHAAAIEKEQELDELTSASLVSRNQLADAIDEAGGVAHAPGFFAEQDEVQNWRHRPDRKDHLKRTEEYAVELGIGKSAIDQYREHILAVGDAHSKLYDAKGSESDAAYQARINYEHNREAFQNAALADARQAGVEVDFGGSNNK